MEARFGHDFGRVRVHADGAAAESARALRARAYTIGSDIGFASGEYAPATATGMRLLAHELAHTVQQQSTAAQPLGRLEISQPMDTLETEADHAAQTVLAGGAMRPLASRLHRSPPRIARAPDGEADPAKASAAAATTILPFQARQPGEDGGWDSAAILLAAQIDPASVAGKAIAAGPDAVWKASHGMALQTLEELKTITTPDAYWAALLKASLTCSVFAISLTFLEATYGELRDFAALANMLAKGGEEQRSGLLAWSSQPPVQATAAQPAAEAAPPAPAAANAASVSPREQELRDTAIGVLGEIMGGQYSAAVDSVARNKWIKFFGTAKIEDLRKTTPGYTTCGALTPYMLDKLALVPDQGIMSGGLGGVRDGIPVMVTDDKDPTKKKQLSKKKTAENEAAVKASYGPEAWIDDNGLVYKAGARHLGVWIDNTGGKERPQPGDIYLLEGNISKEGEAPVIGIRHIGVFKSKSDNKDGTETWITNDAGQGQGVAQEAKEVPRTYNPADRTIKGGAETSAMPPVVAGWVSLGKMQRLAEMTQQQRIDYINNRLAESMGQGGSTFTHGAILKVFQSAPAAERQAIYQAIEGHPWEGDFKVDAKGGAKGVDRLYMVMGVQNPQNVKETERKFVERQAAKRRQELKDLIGQQATST